MSVAPFVQTPLSLARKILDISQIKSNEMFYDLGCGDGRLVILAAENVGAQTTGVEIREDLVQRARAEVKRLRLEDRVTIIQADLFDVPLSEADVVTLYLSRRANERLRPKLDAELKPGARVISHDFEIPGWKTSAIHVHEFGAPGENTATIYAYRIGEQT
jgi:cyclopropane fatty-acyl-phospholipid synthase-like methyltransferase